MVVRTAGTFTLASALVFAVPMFSCAPVPSVSGDCDVLLFDGAAVFPRDDLDVLLVLDVTGRVSVVDQADLLVRILGAGVDGDRDGNGVPGSADFEPLSDVHVAFVTGGLGAGCDEAAATTLAACGATPFVAYGKYGTPPRPTRAEVEAALRCALSLPRPSCASHQPFEAAARALAVERTSPTGFRRPGAPLSVISLGGPGACDGPTGLLAERAIWELFELESPWPSIARVCTEPDAAIVADEYIGWGPDRIFGLCLPREVQRDELGVPACEVEETIGWPDGDACAALASEGRDPIPIRVDSYGHATCRVVPVDTLPDGMPASAARGFYVDNWSTETVSICGTDGTLLRWTVGVELPPGSTVHVRCVAASSTCR